MVMGFPVCQNPSPLEPIVSGRISVPVPARSGIPRHIVALHFKVRLAGGGGHLVESYLRLYSA